MLNQAKEKMPQRLNHDEMQEKRNLIACQSNVQQNVLTKVI